MNNERGAAIAMVLLILGVVSLIAAGLMVQRQFDSIFTMAQRNVDKMFNLADGAALVALSQVGISESMEYKGGQTTTYSVDSTGLGQDRVGSWKSRAMFKGYDTNPQLMSGYELGTAEGYHLQFWLAEGTAQRNSASGPAESAVQIAVNKFARNL